MCGTRHLSTITFLAILGNNDGPSEFKEIKATSLEEAVKAIPEPEINTHVIVIPSDQAEGHDRRIAFVSHSLGREPVVDYREERVGVAHLDRMGLLDVLILGSVLGKLREPSGEMVGGERPRRAFPALGLSMAASLDG